MGMHSFKGGLIFIWSIVFAGGNREEGIVAYGVARTVSIRTLFNSIDRLNYRIQFNRQIKKQESASFLGNTFEHMQDDPFALFIGEISRGGWGYTVLEDKIAIAYNGCTACCVSSDQASHDCSYRMWSLGAKKDWAWNVAT